MFMLTELDAFRKTPLPPNYPANVRTLYSPKDDIHAALLKIIKAAEHRLVVAMYGLDDEALAAALLEQMKNPAVQVILTLDSSQAGGVHERTLLADMAFPATSVAVGRSERGAIMHLKMLVADDVRVSGSTNWSDGGESKQDNELTVVADKIVADEAADRIAEIHAWMLTHAAALTGRQA